MLSQFSVLSYVSLRTTVSAAFFSFDAISSSSPDSSSSPLSCVSEDTSVSSSDIFLARVLKRSAVNACLYRMTAWVRNGDRRKAFKGTQSRIFLDYYRSLKVE